VEGQKRHEYKFPVTRALGVSCIFPDSTRPTPPSTPRRRYFITFLPLFSAKPRVFTHYRGLCFFTVCVSSDIKFYQKNHRTRKSNTKRLFFLYSLFTCSVQILHRSQGGFFSSTDDNMNMNRGGGGGGETVKRNDIKKEILRFKKRDRRRAHPFLSFLATRKRYV
jgi:hypothetical protein